MLAPPVPQIKAFEVDLLKLTSNISFRKVKDPFFNKINKDIFKFRHPRTYMYLRTTEPTFIKLVSKITTNYFIKM